jgi:hypothetical protein
MVASILIAWSSILRREVAGHEAFMIRAYALGQGAGTQVLVLMPWMLISGESGGLTRDLLMTLAWGINVVVAEWIIRSRRSAIAADSPPTGRSAPERPADLVGDPAAVAASALRAEVQLGARWIECGARELRAALSRDA